MMSDITNGSGALARTSKQLDTVHPHYFNSFQNYCCGPKSRLTSSKSPIEYLPIPERFKIKASEMLNGINNNLIQHLLDITRYTSVLPHEFFNHDNFIESQRYLIDSAMFKMMQETQVINWMPSLKRLYPVRTSGNGNCLLHAVLIAMVGVHDFDLYLRDLLHNFMNTNKAILKGSWKAERIKTDKMYGIQSENSKLDVEWEELCDLVRYENSDDGQTASRFQFLEAVHVFSICNMLGRPIIVLSEDVVRNKHGEAIGYNDLFGIYLPTLWKPEKCVPMPIVLAYDQSHFCPLQTTDLNSGVTKDNFLPLYQSIDHSLTQRLLPIRFLGVESNVEQTNELLQRYLRIENLAFYRDSNGPPLNVVCAELSGKSFQYKDNFFTLYYEYIMDFMEAQKKKKKDEEDFKMREQEYHSGSPYNLPSYDTSQRSFIQQDRSPSSPSYSSISTRMNDHRNPSSLERRPSYDKAVANGTSYTPSDKEVRSINQYSETQHAQKAQTHVYINYDKHQPMNEKLPTNKSEWDSDNNDRISNGKTSITSNNSPRGSDSQLKQAQQQPQILTRVPVNYVKNDFSTPNFIDFEPRIDRFRSCIHCKRYASMISATGFCSECDYDRRNPFPGHTKSEASSTNLIDFEQETDRIRGCIVCKQLFDDSLSTGLCHTCDYKKTRSVPRAPIPLRSTPATTYPRFYQNSDFISPISIPSKGKTQLKIICSHCNGLNLLQNGLNRMDRCSMCQHNLQIPHY